jgi:hypothetical protein
MAVSWRADSPTEDHTVVSYLIAKWVPLVHTNNTVDLNQVARNRLIGSRSHPVQSNSIGLYTSKRDLRRLRYLDTKNADELGDRFPKGLPCPIQEPAE